jgi:monofunctional biosynthetic peptidoglycan transglycosylase
MIKRIFHGAVRVVALLIIAAIVSITVSVNVYRCIEPPLTPLILIRYFEGGLPEHRIQYFPMSIDNLPDHLIRAVLAAEDSRFLCHDGFDFTAIKIAMKNNMRSERIIGGSTISQQTAKNLFLWPGRSWFRKGLEAGITVLLEISWSKKRILEVYLNIAEFGEGIFGIEAASQYHFNKPSSQLSAFESVQLVSILPYPHRWSPVDPDERLLRKQLKISRKMAGIPFECFDCEYDCTIKDGSQI